MSTERPLLDRSASYTPAVPSTIGAVHLELTRFWDEMNGALVPSVAEIWKHAFETGFSEIWANVVKYAFLESPQTGTMEFHLWLYENRVEAEITDDGSMFKEISNPINPTLPDIPESGRGLQVARSLLDNLDYRRSQEFKNHWLLVKYLT